MSRRTLTALRPLATGLLLVAIAALLPGCSTSTPPSRNTLRNPRDLALTCRKDGAYVALDQCTSAADVRAFVTGGSLGSIVIGEPVANRWIDADPSVPGFSPRIVGDLPQAIVADPETGGRLYFGLGLQPRIGRMDGTSLDLAFFDLTFVPAGIAAATIDGGAVLWLADPEGGAVWRLPTSAFDTAAAAERFDVGGSPWSLAVAPDGRVVVGHLEHDHVTILASDGVVLQRVGLGPACGDGLDNDGDGFADAADEGCDDANDDNEANAELAAQCTDSLDNDGDGKIDALDPGCAATPTVDTCRDGIDNDGDGLTDFPADPGCTAFAGASERLDQPSCADGIDNDADGFTDFPDDADCNDAKADGERGTTVVGIVGPCNDGIDNDGDGLTDFPADTDCSAATASGESRPACADGIDNDGDGKTDLDDEACLHRGSPSEVAADADPVAVVAVTYDGRFATIGHRARRAIYVLDMATLSLVVPKVGSHSPFNRPSRLDAREGLRGIALQSAPLAMAPVHNSAATIAQEAMAISLSMQGMALLTFDAEDENGATILSIDFVPSKAVTAPSANKPLLLVDGSSVDLGDIPPVRYPNPGLLTKLDAEDGRIRHFGLLPGTEAADHRNELWRMIYQGQIPGSERGSGRLMRPDVLVDSTADFCRMGVVAGDLLLLRRQGEASSCDGKEGETLRYRVVEVLPDRLLLDPNGGVVDRPVTAENQLEAQPAAETVGLPELSCWPDGGIHYEVRADGFLVIGSRSGLLSSRGRDGASCAAWSETDPLAASRAPLPELAAGIAAPSVCPISDEALAVEFVSPVYGGDAQVDLRPFENAVFSVQMRPGCAASDVVGELPRLLPGIRDATWRWNFNAGFLPRLTAVGSAAVSLRTAPGMASVFVVDQGAGTLGVVNAVDGVVTAAID
ncbi:MAG: hypothetical protein H6747_00560 [Deltaproteobacteria bacterium]|nr:hypothetical protein [Deltaproteobacteria bacterium]